MRLWLRTLWSRGVEMLHRRRLEREFAEELATHLELLVDEGVRSGLPPDEARRAAILTLGRPQSLREIHREQRGLPMLDVLAQDLRYAVRTLWKSRMLTGVAVLSLALGIGANAALFSLIDSLLLRSLPVRDPDRLVQVEQVMAGLGIRKKSPFLAPPVFDAAHEQTPLFSEIVGFAPLERPLVTIDGADEPPRTVEEVSVNYFRDLGVPPAIGRYAGTADGPAAIISDRLWRTRFNAAQDVVGRAIAVGGRPYTIAGVAPARFHGLSIEDAADVWISSPERRPLRMIARLAPGVSAGQAQARMHALIRQVAQEHPRLFPWDERLLTEVTPAGRGLSNLRAQYERPLAALGVLVALLLLITCANVGGLLVVRNAARRRELSVRAALGASRARLAVQSLVESAVLAALGGCAGLLVAGWGVSIILSMLPYPEPPPALLFHADARVLAFVAAISIASALFFGLVPTMRAGHVDLATALRTSQGTTPLARTRRTGRVLVACQVALSVLLIVAAGLFVQTLRNLARFDVGFDPHGVVQFWLDTRGAGYRQGQVGPLYRLLLERAAAIPGVAAVTAIRNPVMTGGGSRGRCEIPGYPLAEEEGWNVADVGPAFFETMGIRLLRGRTFTAADFAQNRRVAVASDAFARRYFAGQDPVGRVVCRDVEIIGVVADARLAAVREDMAPMLYSRLPEDPDRVSGLEARVAGDPAAVMAAIRQAIRTVNPRLLLDAKPITRQIELSLARERMVASISAFFGVLALLLAGVGMFGVASYAVAQRTAELGIRMALGAGRWRVVWDAMRETMLVFAAGLAAGIAAAVVAVRVTTSALSSLLFELAPTDAANFAAAVLVMTAVALAACALPARRATRIDPLAAIRCE